MDDLRLAVDARTHLRTVAPGDEDALFALVDAHREALRVRLPWVDGATAPADTRRFIDQACEECRLGKGYHFGIEYDSALAGVIGVNDADLSNRTGNLGYWLSPDLHGRGIMTAAGRVVVDFAFREIGLNRLELATGTDNAASIALAGRLGFTREGTFREAEWVGGRFIDHARFGLLRRDWDHGPDRGAWPSR